MLVFADSSCCQMPLLFTGPTRQVWTLVNLEVIHYTEGVNLNYIMHLTQLYIPQLSR